MSIRRMNFSDLNEVINLYQDANLFAKKKDIQDWTKNGLEKYPHLNFVYEQNGKIIGAISAIFTKSKKIEINDIVVQKKYRGKTIGSRLMNKLLNSTKKYKIGKIALWVHYLNAAAIPFYYTFGFRITKSMKTKRIAGVPDGEDVICLEKYV